MSNCQENRPRKNAGMESKKKKLILPMEAEKSEKLIPKSHDTQNKQDGRSNVSEINIKCETHAVSQVEKCSFMLEGQHMS